jgi:excisionase family DNA binding protein
VLTAQQAVGVRFGQSVPVRASKPVMDAWQIVSALRTRPRGYVPDDKYATVVGVLTGFDEAQSGGALAGFQELVELKFGSHSSIVWWWLALKIEPAVEDQADEAKVSRLLDLVEEYLAVDSGVHGRRRIFHEWMALRPPDPDLVRFSQSPSRATVSVDDAANSLGVDRRRVFQLIHDQRLGVVGRVGPEVRLRREAVEALAGSHDET